MTHGLRPDSFTEMVNILPGAGGCFLNSPPASTPSVSNTEAMIQVRSRVLSPHLSFPSSELRKI